MADITQLSKLSKLTGESDVELLSLFLDMSESRILSYTNRRVLSDSLKQTQLDWALVAYNRQGTEGELSRSEGGVSSTFAEIPKAIEVILKNHRIARCGGRAYAKEPS